MTKNVSQGRSPSAVAGKPNYHHLPPVGFVYILGNWSGGVLYIGVTSDLRKRVWEHRAKVFEGFTSAYNVSRLLYYEQFAEISDAIDREKWMKKKPRSVKVKLIELMNPGWEDLYERI